MKKIFCDICKKRITEDRGNIEDCLVDDLLELLEIEDVCGDCTDKLNRADLETLVRDLVNKVAGIAGKE